MDRRCKHLLGGILLFLSLHGPLSGATHYVSASGSATWANSTSISTPCSISTAMLNASAGDLVYLRGGSYTYTGTPAAAYHGVYEPINSGTGDSDNQRIIFRAYTGETPAFTVNWSNDAYTGFIFGTNESHYITYDGITVQCAESDENAGFMIGGDMDESHANGNIVTNCTIIGGTVANNATDDNYDLNRIEDCDDCEFSHNTVGPFPGGRTGYDSADNYGGLKGYHIIRADISNNDFIDCENGAIVIKGYTTDCTIAYNYFHGGEYGIRTPSYAAGPTPTVGLIMHDNVFNATGLNAYWLYAEEIIAVSYGNQFYNNTIYNSGTGLQIGNNSDAAHGWKIYNNIFSTTTQAGSLVHTCYIAELDHNNWGNGSFSVFGYISLANLQASSLLVANSTYGYDSGGCTSNQHPGCGDRQDSASNIFVNASGTFAHRADFQVQGASLTAGRSGGMMGADISLVGTGAPSTPAPPTISNCTISNGLIQ